MKLLKKAKKHKMLKNTILGFVLFTLLLVGKYCLTYKTETFIRSKVVSLEGPSNHYFCSGTQIKAPSGKNYILSASHCLALAENGIINAKDDLGNFIPRRVIEEDKNSDLLLIEALPNLEGLDVAKTEPHLQDQFRAFTHGKRFETFKSVGEYIEQDKVIIPAFVIENKNDVDKCKSMSKYAEVHDIMNFGPITVDVAYCALNIESYFSQMIIAGGSSGGCVVNDDGDLTAVVYAGDTTFAFLVPLSSIQKFIKSY